ncbi:hypothetical protein [Muricoccus radiodurans]
MPEPVTMTEAERDAFYRRRRARNLGMLAVLIVMVLLFYVISMVRVKMG